MKKLLLLGLLVLIVVFTVYGEASAGLPRDYQEFRERYQREARTEQGALRLLFEGIYCYMNEATRDEASKMLRYALYNPQPIEMTRTLATFVERLKDESYHHIFRSYAVGATPENNYSMSPDNFRIEVTRTQRVPGDDVNLYIRSGGADSPRPVRMRQHDGLWYTAGVGSIITGVRDPRSVTGARSTAHDADFDSEGQWDEPEKETDEENFHENNLHDSGNENDSGYRNDSNGGTGGDLEDLW